METRMEKLVRLHNFIEWYGAFITTAHRFLINTYKQGDQL